MVINTQVIDMNKTIPKSVQSMIVNALSNFSRVTTRRSFLCTIVAELPNQVGTRGIHKQLRLDSRSSILVDLAYLLKSEESLHPIYTCAPVDLSLWVCYTRSEVLTNKSDRLRVGRISIRAIESVSWRVIPILQDLEMLREQLVRLIVFPPDVHVVPGIDLELYSS